MPWVKNNTAIKVAIEAMEKVRSRYAVGHNAFVLNWDFSWAKRDHENYEKISRAIEVVNAFRD